MRSFRVEPAEAGALYLVFDHPARSVNVLDEAALADLNVALVELERVKPAGVILKSGKVGSFIAGADLQAISSITDQARVLELIRLAHGAFNRLAALPCPTVAAIDGVCLGGGTELALACDSRREDGAHRTRGPGCLAHGARAAAPGRAREAPAAPPPRRMAAPEHRRL